jgi:hypothetical protein
MFVLFWSNLWPSLDDCFKLIGRVQFEVFEKFTSVCFFKLHEKPYYYLVIIYMKKICSHVRKSQRKLRNFHLFLFFGLYFTFWHCISKKFPLLLANQNWEMFSCIKTPKNISKTRCSHNVVQPRRDIGGIKTEEHEHMQK